MKSRTHTPAQRADAGYRVYDESTRDRLQLIGRAQSLHGDYGAGIGTSHQSGWTGFIAPVIQSDGALTAELVGERNLEQLAIKMGRDQSHSGKQ